MSNLPTTKKYDLEDRTLDFAKRARLFVQSLPYSISNKSDSSQLIRSSGSIGANYIEANGCLGKKDFLMHIKICRKEAKETMYWLTLIDTGKNDKLDSLRKDLVLEANQLTKIFNAIATKFKF